MNLPLDIRSISNDYDLQYEVTPLTLGEAIDNVCSQPAVATNGDMSRLSNGAATSVATSSAVLLCSDTKNGRRISTVVACEGPHTRPKLRAPHINKSRLLLSCYAVMATIAFCVMLYLFLRVKLSNRSNSTTVCLTPSCVSAASMMLKKMNLAVEPCVDFYEFACGGWINDTVIPGAFREWHEIYRLGIDAWKQLRYIIELAPQQLSRVERQVVLLYKSCTKLGAIRSVGIRPIRDYLSQWNGWMLNNVSYPQENLQLLLTNTHYFVQPVFFLAMVMDDKNTSRYVIRIDQPPMMLPGPNFYFNTTTGEVFTPADSQVSGGPHWVCTTNVSFANPMPPFFKMIVTVMNYTATLFDIDANEANKTAHAVQQFAAEMYQVINDRFHTTYSIINYLLQYTLPISEKGNLSKYYHQTTLADVQTMAPFMDWTQYIGDIFADHQFDSSEPLVINNIYWFTNMSRVVMKYQKTEEGRRIIDSFIKWRVVLFMLPYIDEGVFPENLQNTINSFAGLSPFLRDDRWLFCVTRALSVMPLPTVSLYATAKVSTRKIKQQVDKLTGTVLKVLQNEIKTLDWMDDYTRKTALKKAERTVRLIAIPDMVFNKSALDEHFKELNFTDATFLVNMMEARKSDQSQTYKTLRDVPIRTKWDENANPLFANAYYSFKQNRVVIPVVVLGAPIFLPDGPDAVNYGSLGSIIGHELTHAFDSRGVAYDEKGSLRTWWSESSRREYYKRAHCLVDQYSNYSYSGLSTDGALSMNENQADNGALKLAHMAYNLYSKDRGATFQFPGLNLTSEQVFFLSFAQTWCTKYSKQFDLARARMSNHSPTKIRVMGTLHNMYEFSAAYKCKSGSPMNPLKKCPNLW